MKKIIQILLLMPIFIIIGYLVFTYKSGTNAVSLYKVYLNGEIIGIIDSKDKLEQYINNKGEEYKKTYGVDNVYVPEGIEIEKLDTYFSSVNTVKEVYNKIVDIEPFTIKGYEFTIKSEDSSLTIYTLSADILDEAIEKNYVTYVGQDEYDAYVASEQNEIKTTGAIIENMYIDEDITMKETYIPLDKKIYQSADELAQYFLFGETNEREEYTVKVGDTIDEIALEHEISTREFLISNPTFTSEKDLLFPGQVVLIGITDPQISVVVEEYVVEDKIDQFQVEYQYDSEKTTSYEEVLQTGSDGLRRITQRNKIVNGDITYVENISKEILISTVNQVSLKGEKIVSGIGSYRNWIWPTESGYTITSGYGYRYNPFGGSTAKREFHQALDIAGTGYGSNIYVATSGVVVFAKYESTGGNYICVNHNVNNLYTCYAHLSKMLVKAGDTVERGQIIGYMGATGNATGPHLHFEVWIGYPWRGYRINPWKMY